MMDRSFTVHELSSILIFHSHPVLKLHTINETHSIRSLRTVHHFKAKIMHMKHAATQQQNVSVLPSRGMVKLSHYRPGVAQRVPGS